MLSRTAPDASPSKYGTSRFWKIQPSPRGFHQSAGRLALQPCVPYCPRRPPRTRRSTDFCPPGRLSSRSHADPHPKSHRGEVSEAESSRTWCQPQSTKGQRSPVASNGRRVGRWNPEARGCKKTKISAYEGVFLPSLAPPEACTLQKEPTKTLNFCNKKISL